MNNSEANIKSVNFISWSDLAKGLNQERMDAISSAIADRVNWGYCVHSLIKASSIIEDLGAAYSPPLFHLDSIRDELQKFIANLDASLVSVDASRALAAHIIAAHEEALQQENDSIGDRDEAEFVRRIKALPPNTFVDLET